MMFAMFFPHFGPVNFDLGSLKYIGHWTNLDWKYFQGWLYRWRERNVKDEDVADFLRNLLNHGGRRGIVWQCAFQSAKLDSSDMPTWCCTSVYWCTPVIIHNAMQCVMSRLLVLFCLRSVLEMIPSKDKGFDQLTDQQQQQQQQEDNKWLYLPNLNFIAIFTSLALKKHHGLIKLSSFTPET